MILRSLQYYSASHKTSQLPYDPFDKLPCDRFHQTSPSSFPTNPKTLLPPINLAILTSFGKQNHFPRQPLTHF
jgi:hypothetical protein